MSTNDNDNIPSFEELLADPEIEALLDFEPVPRRNKKQGGWSAQMQRLFIARLARHGSPGKACDELGMYRSGIDKVFKSAGAESFRGAWAGAVELAERRRAEEAAAGFADVSGLTMPFVDNRRKAWFDPPPEEPDAAALAQMAEDARDSISKKLLNARRLYLAEICDSPGKRAAFEILTELPIDWDKAARLQPQDDEPWRAPSMREPDMLLTAENGWMGDMAHGPDKKRELQEALNRHLIETGQEALDWSAEGNSAEHNEQSRSDT